MSQRALAHLWEDVDKRFFAQHSDRYCHIRKPYAGECDAEFLTLGYHEKDRRRIILWRMPSDNRYYNPDRPQISKIPFLLFADETVEDTDEVLRPIVHELMINEGVTQGVVSRA